MAAADRLSVLPDDVLQHVLSFAPAREAAASALLSRRWRSLWRRTSAVILDSRHYQETTLSAFFNDAHTALAALHRPCGGTGLKRLTLFVDEGTDYLSDTNSWEWDSNDAEPEAEPDRMVADLLANPAVARLEELSVTCQDNFERRYVPALDSLPFAAATLRVLELTGCTLQSPGGRGLSFQHLTDLTLRDCFFFEAYLQAMLDAAPALSSLALVNVIQWAPEPPSSGKKKLCFMDYYRLHLRLVCQTLTALVLLVTDPNEEELEASLNEGSGIELDMPSLRFFRYCGYRTKLSLTSPALGLARVDFDATRGYEDGWSLKYQPPLRTLETFSGTRALKLRLDCIEHIVANGDDEHFGIVLPTFPNLKLLEIDGKYQYMSSKTAVATAMLLRSCPVMSELRLRLNIITDYDYHSKYEDHIGGPFGEAMDRFESVASMSSAHRAAVQVGGISDLPAALTNNYAFSCLKESLRKVTLRFTAKEVNCFEVQLAKFLAENAMVLEEMHIDDGSQLWSDRLFHKVAKWRADAFRRRNMPDTGGFRVTIS